MIASAPHRGRDFVWRGLLRLRLGRRDSPAHIHGWAVAASAADWIRLEAASRIMTAHIVVHRGPQQLTVALFLRYDRAPAALLWLPIAPFHRRAVPTMLRRALGTLR